MITTQEQAVNHAKHVHAKYKNVAVLSDGQIYVGNDESVQKAIDGNKTVFIVRGELQKTKKKPDGKTE